ncbi:Dockerin type I repeat protein [Stieleria magnilauensis]|uniref:Dockerin type I repeat protein n=2 Tax=Stieleria magnilauensis TaxID=2527963 RepID=A0ABX5XN56_9BACT|nr:Dockerin type I repeat protein [Planctomycetes bacterium TBK1r]
MVEISVTEELLGDRVSSSDGLDYWDRAGAIKTTYDVTNVSDRQLTQITLSDSSYPDDNNAAVTQGAKYAKVVHRGLPSYAMNIASRPDMSNLLPHPTRKILVGVKQYEDSVVVVETDGYNELTRIAVGTDPSGLAFSADGKELFVVLASAERLSVIDTTTWLLDRTLELPFVATDVMPTAHGDLLIVRDNRLHRFDSVTGATLGMQLNGFSSASLRSGGDEMVAVGEDGKIRMYDVTGPVITLIETSFATTGTVVPTRFQFPNDSEWMLVEQTEGGCSRGIVRWKSGFKFPLQGGCDSAWAFSNDGRFLYGAYSNEVHLWHVESMRFVTSFDLPVDAYEMVVDPSDEYLYVKSLSGYSVYTTGRSYGDEAIAHASWNKSIDPGETWQFTANYSYQARSNLENRASSKMLVEVEGAQHGEYPHTLGTEIYDASTPVDKLAVRVGHTSQGLRDSDYQVVVEGETITWTVYVKNNSGVLMTDLVVTGVINGTGEVLVGQRLRDGDSGFDPFESFAPGKTWTFVFESTATRGVQTMDVTATASSRTHNLVITKNHSDTGKETPVTALDFDFAIDSTTNFLSEERTNHIEELDAGAPIRWDYRVTNNSNYSIPAISITDNRSIENDLSIVAGGFSSLHTDVPWREYDEREEYIFGRSDSEGEVRAIAKDPVRPLLYVAGYAPTIDIYDLDHRSKIGEIDVSLNQDGCCNRIERLHPLDDHRLIAVTAYGPVIFVDLDSRSVTHVMAGDELHGARAIGFDHSSDVYLLKKDSIERLDRNSLEVVASIRVDSGWPGGTLGVFGDTLVFLSYFREAFAFDISADAIVPLWEKRGARSGVAELRYSGELVFTEDADGVAFIHFSGRVGHDWLTGSKVRLRDGHLVGANATHPSRSTRLMVPFVSHDQRYIYGNVRGAIVGGNTATLLDEPTVGVWARFFEDERFRTETEIVPDDSHGLIYGVREGKLVAVSTSRPANGLLDGDVNHNGLLDPGETWLFQLLGRAADGDHQIQAQLEFSDVEGTVHRLVQSVSYSASVNVEEVVFSVRSNVAWLEIADLSPWIGTTRPLIHSLDARFEMDKQVLRLGYFSHLVSGEPDSHLLLIDAMTRIPILSVTVSVVHNPYPSHNWDLVHDVNRDGDVTPLDALNVINWIGRSGNARLPEVVYPGSQFVDVNADQKATPLDALLVINALAIRVNGIEAEPIPQPHTKSTSEQTLSTPVRLFVSPDRKRRNGVDFDLQFFYDVAYPSSVASE